MTPRRNGKGMGLAVRLGFGLVVLGAGPAAGLIHAPSFDHDARAVFEIETFGFLEGGVMDFRIQHFGVYTKAPAETYACLPAANTAQLAGERQCAYKVGLLMMRTASKSATQQHIEMALEDPAACLLDQTAEDEVLLDLSDPDTWDDGHAAMSLRYVVPPGKAGFYSLIFNRCVPQGPADVGFKLHASFYNPGPDFLSAGDAPLPVVYYCFAGAFFFALAAWVSVLRKSDAKNVMHIHKLMAVLVVFKVLTLLFDAARFHVVKRTGHTDVWTVAFYVFTFLRSISLFVVILLIGTGWSLLKPSLNDREKKIIFVVLCLQVLDNIAFLVVDETSPGSQAYVEWRDVLHLVDIACCCAILFPIVWSIRHLRQGTGTDGKAAGNLKRLETFRTFYIMVITYIYFTRIVVYLLAATLPFQYIWLKEFFEEFATLIFYVLTGFKFRPAEDNPYAKLGQDDVDDEFGLGDEGVETSASREKTVLTEV